MKPVNLLKQAQFHGAIRLAENNYRWYWAVALSALFGCSVTVVLVTVNRYLDNPTFMVRQETIYPNMAFPSVLVCPEITFHDEKIDQFIQQMIFPPNIKASYIKKVIRQLAAFYSPDVVYCQETLERIEQLLEYNGLDMDQAGRKLMPTCEETLIRCRWHGKIMNCSLLFHMELTGDGYCCVFNGRSLTREIVEYGFQSEAPADQWVTSTFGYTSGLMLAINQTQKLDDVDLSYKWIALQGNQHYVETPVNGTPLNPGFEHWASYTSQGFQIGEFARSLSDWLRRCRLADQPLKMFPLYHKKYCILECEIQRTIDRCNCARAVHPKPPGVETCDAQRLICSKHAMISSDAEDCNCPQACDVAQDLVQMSSFQLKPEVVPFDRFYEGLNFSTVTIVRAFVQNTYIKTKSRWSYFTSLDLFAQLGGVFNVFFGVSIFTILELIQLALHGLRHRIKGTMTQPKKLMDSKPIGQLESSKE